MIVTAVVCPHPPALLRELCGAEDTVPELRSACAEAVADAVSSGPDAVFVVGGATESREWDASLPIGVRRFGTTHAPDAVGLPQSLGVARRLLDEAGWTGQVRMVGVAWEAGPDAVEEVARAVADEPGRVLVLVMADGSARRGEKAPGHLDERAVPLDDRIGQALEAGDPQALSALDPALAADLLVQGRAALAVLGAVVAADGGRPKPSVLYRDDPHGVMYTVAVWDLA